MDLEKFNVLTAHSDGIVEEGEVRVSFNGNDIEFLIEEYSNQRRDSHSFKVFLTYKSDIELIQDEINISKDNLEVIDSEFVEFIYQEYKRLVD
jgi:hypothetical protein